MYFPLLFFNFLLLDGDEEDNEEKDRSESDKVHDTEEEQDE